MRVTARPQGDLALDPRLNTIRGDLADSRLKGTISSPRYADGKRAVIKAGLVPVRHAPLSDSEVVTYYFCGEDIRVFDEGGGYLWCQSSFDHYVGYVEAAAVDLNPVGETTHVVCTMGSYSYQAPDLRTPVAEFLPRHGCVTIVDQEIVTRGTSYRRLSNDTYVPARCLSESPPSSSSLAEAAANYLGCPYLWGGKSFLGLDCAGLVQNCFRDLGQMVLRDSDMQRATIGTDVAVTELVRDDLIFIPGHVMIYAGDGDIIHADGRTMSVRRERLEDFLQLRGLTLSSLTVRRPMGAKIDPV